MRFSDHQRGEGDLQAKAEARLSCPTSPCCWGHAHLGDLQGILGDVVLQGSTIAVALCPERQAPGRAHGAVLLDITEVLQDLQGHPTHRQAQSPVSDPVQHPSLPLYCRSPTRGTEGGAPWEDSADIGGPSHCALGSHTEHSANTL